MAKTKTPPALERAADTTVTTAGAPAANRPVAVFRLRGVRAAVFVNRTEASDGGGTLYYKVSLQRIYRDGEEWKTTASLGRDDLPVARLLLQRAWEWVLETEAAARGDGEPLHQSPQGDRR